jgi:hypothetical protein
MKTNLGLLLPAIVLFVAINAVSGESCSPPPKTSARSSTPQDRPQLIAGYGQIPLHFEANQGQADSRVKYLARGPGYSLVLTPTEVGLQLRSGESGVGNRMPGSATPIAELGGAENGSRAPSSVRMKLVGADPLAVVSGQDPLPGKVNYFKGNDPAQWRANISTYAKVKYHEVYSGIDLVFYGNQRQLEYDLVVAPGADPNQIQLSFDGADRIELADNGDLVLHLGDAEIRQHKPRIFQLEDGQRKVLAGQYRIERPTDQTPSQATAHASVVTFAVAAYDRSKPLVIDPVLVYSTYLGGSGNDYANAIAVDSTGHAYIAGSTLSVDFPTRRAFQPTYGDGIDGFIAKLTPDGKKLVFATYLGGASWDSANGIAVDAFDMVVVVGSTWSNDFPLENPIQTPHPTGTMEAFITKLSADGAELVFSTVLGGSGHDVAHAVALDATGNIFVAGTTGSTDFPATAGAVQPFFAGYDPESWQNSAGDAFAAKLSADGTALVYATYLGGSSDESGTGIAVDATGHAYVVGCTRSLNFPVTLAAFQQHFAGGYSDYFVTKLNPDASALVYSTYLGGTGQDHVDFFYYGGGIALDSSGCAYVTGCTGSTDFPTKNPFQANKTVSMNAFVTKLNADGSDLAYSTYLGSEAGASGHGIAVDVAGNVWLTGWAVTYTGCYGPGRLFPVVNPVRPYGGGLDPFVAKFDPDGSALLFSTFLGGSGSGDPGVGEIGRAIAVDQAGNAYVAGTTPSADFPTANALQPVFGGGYDAFVAKIADPDVTAPVILFATTHGTRNLVEVRFSESVSEASAIDPGNYTVDGRVSVFSAAMGGDSKTVVLTTSGFTDGTTYTLTVNHVQDRGLPTPNSIAKHSRVPIFQTLGRLTRKEFRAIPGVNLTDLAYNTAFPNHPTQVDYPEAFESPTDIHDNYGVQMLGYVHPPVTGDYVFYLCSSGPGALYFSSDEDPAHKQAIASEPQGNLPREWITGTNPRGLRVAESDVFGPDTFFIEAEDFDFGGGQHVTGVPIGMNGPYAGGAYQGQGTAADAEIDWHEQNPNNDAPVYRPATGVEAAKPGTGGYARGTFDVTANYVVGWNDAGDWMNYTRLFPEQARDYSVFARLASGGAAMHAEMDEVTSGAGTSTQTTSKLGEFVGPATGGWDTFVIVPLTDDSGGLAPVNLGGQRTLRFTTLPGNLDIDYLALKRLVGPPPEFRPPNISAPVRLEAGRKYYIEALMKAGYGSDNLGVAWQLPEGPPPVNGDPPIAGQYLEAIVDAAVVVVPARAAMLGLSPSVALAKSGGFDLAVSGAGFDPSAVVLWNDSPRATTFVSESQLVAHIAASDIASGADLNTAIVTVANPGAALSDPVPLPFVSRRVGAVQSACAYQGGWPWVTTAFANPGQGGLTAYGGTVNDPCTDYLAMTVANFTGNPGCGPIFDAGGGFVGLQVLHADADDLVYGYFYYPASMTGALEAGAVLFYWSGAAWMPVLSTGGTPPQKDTTDNPDGTGAGGRFTVTFDGTSTPKLTKLKGTVFIVSLLDGTPPVIVCPANLTVPCNPARLVAVAFTVTATDNSDPSPTITCTPPSGSGFPVGTTIVTATATDLSGNRSTCRFTVTRAPLCFTGFLPPIGGADATGGSYANPVRSFQLKSTIPVKFAAACNGSAVVTGVHTLQAIKWSSPTKSASPIDAAPTDAATSGNRFRLAGKEWYFNLDTRATGMSVGKWQLIATLSDGSQHSVWIQIK